MLIDLEVTEAHFIRGIRNLLRKAVPCLAPAGASQQPFLLDHVEITDNTLLQRIPQTMAVHDHQQIERSIDGSAVQITQEMLLYATSLAVLEQSGAGTIFPYSIWVRFAVTLHAVTDSQPVLHLDYLGSNR